ncbi:glycoside hydrolase family 18 protein [Xylariaceae sp. FL0255]|nr:glycoside hydrolase family 18 protein [Xylariaceae sp. FL0255]
MHAASSSSLPRLVIYHQTTHTPEGKLISILPLITQPRTTIKVTHLIIAAIHINEDPEGLTLNDLPPDDPRFASTWAELRIAQASGITVMGLLGGAAKGSYARLDSDPETFESYYAALYSLIQSRGLQGLDLDVEENMSLAGIVRLIDRLRSDFGADFIITLTPVAAALLDRQRNLSGFDYEALEVMRGDRIAWYNAQFYCGWGDAHTPLMYEMCVARGFPAEKVVMGLVTTPENGAGFVPFEILARSVAALKRRYPMSFGGVMGWEYFNGRPGGKEKPWEWAVELTKMLRPQEPETDVAVDSAARPVAVQQQGLPLTGNPPSLSIDLDGGDVEDSPQVPPPPDNFEYYSDGMENDQ